jgi:trehalose 6-phosphate phosphatase
LPHASENAGTMEHARRSGGNEVEQRLWIFDFDGTLSPMVPVRESAQLHPACSELLGELVARPHQLVAILSSRSLEDLVPRVPVSGIYLGGGSGIEWQMPDGRRVMPDGEWAERLSRTRTSLLPLIVRMAQLPGVEFEDKKWSVALHTRKAAAGSREELSARVGKWQEQGMTKVLRGPEVLEIQFLPEIDKAFGVRTICTLLGFDPAGDAVVYAGDDENDAIAMRWVIYLGGIALSVGNEFAIPGAVIVEGQSGLVREVRRIAGISAEGE